MHPETKKLTQKTCPV